MKRSVRALTIVLGSVALAPAVASASDCSDLAAFAMGTTGVTATAVITGTPAYCQVNLNLSDPPPNTSINIRVGLPLNTTDNGGVVAAGRVQGQWNGKVQNLGGGGFVGTVGAVNGNIPTGWVSSSTDSGHNNAWCNTHSLPNCGVGGGGFVLDNTPAHNIIPNQVTDFIDRSLYEQTRWSLDLAKRYYSMAVARNYWNGCSTGGRQGLQLAQRHSELFDGFLVGAPAINWNRFQTGEMWPAIVVKDILGVAPSPGLTPAKSNAANAAAIAACDFVGTGGVHDGFIAEPRRCTYNANARVCTAPNVPDANCLTQAEADAVNLIWDGPRNQRGQRLWGGIPRGTSFGTLLPGGNNASGLPLTYEVHWLAQDPNWDWKTLTMANFSQWFQYDHTKFRGDATNPLAAASDSVPPATKRNLHGGKAKIIHYRGLADPLIVTFSSHNYDSRVFDYWGVPAAQTVMRSFYYPGLGHCGGGAAPAINTTDLFNALENWVDHGVAPDYIVASQNLGGGVTRTRKICKYPDEAVYTGSGSTNDQANWTCVVHTTEPADLRNDSQTAEWYMEAP